MSGAQSPAAIKELLLEWCRRVTRGYEGVEVKNFSSSWADGMAFCALIHRFYPNAFDFKKLDPKKRGGNFNLAFKVAEKYADIPPLLDVKDMVRMKTPDWKCVFCYIQTFYRRFQNYDLSVDPPRPPEGEEAKHSSTSSQSAADQPSSSTSESKSPEDVSAAADENPSEPSSATAADNE